MLKNSIQCRQRGVSLVEMMVGVAIGLFIIGGALSLFATSAVGSRRTVAEARLQQDLRSMADLVSRDLRRAGYWANAPKGTKTIGPNTTVTSSNPYASMSRTVSSTAGSFGYGFSRDVDENSDGIVEEDDALTSDESFGFLVTADGELKMKTQTDAESPLNDVKYTQVTAFSVTDSSPPPIWLGYRCERVKASSSPNAPFMTLRRFDISITGRSTVDPNIVRTLRTTVRVRNDLLQGNCD